MSTPEGTPAHDSQFADLVDELLEALLDGRSPDLEELARARPEVAPRLHEAYMLACGVAGRRAPGKPMLGGYRIVREIGRGGMGTVYLAQHEELGREVALKVLPHSLGLSPHSKRRFLAEARALARLQHDHVVRIHRIVDDDELLAFEMEYVDGPSLQEVLAALRERGARATIADLAAALRVPKEQLGAKSPLQFFVQLGVDIGRALAEVHRLGIVHRDVKPSNILLQSANGRALLADFGLARGGDLTITRTGAFAGTPVYAAPEQLRGESIDGRADVYALAVTLYEAIALATPFAGQSSGEMLRRIESGAVPPLRALAPHAPRDLETILQKAMDPEVGGRYADADEFADDLQRLLDLQPIRARRIGPLRRLSRLLRRQRTHLVAGVVGAAAVGLLLWPLLGRVGAAERDARAAADHVRSARQHLLLLPRQGGIELVGALAARRHPRYLPTGQDDSVDHLRAAIADYQQALVLRPDDAALRTEAQIAQLAHWLRTESPEQRSRVEAALAGAGLQDLLRGLPAGVAGLARSYVRDRSEFGEAAAGAPVPRDDLLACGLLAFLVNDLRRCEASWDDLDAAAGEFPLVDAILGILYHADGRPERAYLHLSQAARSLPESQLLRLELAETALAVDDLRPARELLALSPRPRDDLEAARLGLLAADAETKPDRASLRARCERLAEQYPTSPAPRMRLAQLAMDDGDWPRARTLLQKLCGEWPDATHFRLDLARTALQLRDLPTYLRQVHYVVASRYGAGLSTGAARDLLEILQLGGCQRLLRRGLTLTGLDLARPHGAGLHQPVTGLGGPIGALVVEGLVPLAAVLAPMRDPFDSAASLLRCAVWNRAIRRLLAPFVPEARARSTVLSTATALQAQEGLALPDDNLSFGHCMAAAGDLDGDGATDFLLGNPPRDPGISRGIVAVVSGRSGLPLGTFTHDDPTVQFGFAVAAAGDADGDGVGDFVVGAPYGVESGTGTGQALLVSGANARPIHVWRGTMAGFGVSVAGLGDVDGDGVADLAVGSSPELQNRKAQGSATIYSGRTGEPLRTFAADRAGVWFGAAVANAGDVDGDGTNDLIVGGNHLERFRAAGLVRVYSGRTGALLHTWIDDAPEREFGRTVTGAGDIDGDGRADLIVTAPGTGGGVYVFSGRDGRVLALLAGEDADERAGHAVAAGDLDGDGRSEVVLSSGVTGRVAAYSLLPTRLLHEWSGPPGGEGFGHCLAWIPPAPGHGPGRVLAWCFVPDWGTGLWLLAAP